MTEKRPISRKRSTPIRPSAKEVRAVRREFQKVLWHNVETTLDRMRVKGGKVVLNSDDLFKMLPKYAANPAERKILGSLLYPVAAKFTDRVFEMLLKRTADADDDTVVFTAGGSATGKTTILRTAGQKPGVDFILDTTFSNSVRALSQVRKALASNRKVEIHYVYRKFDDSVKSMLRRALDPKSARIVPIDDMARTHFGAQRAVLDALTEFQNDDRVSIVLRENISRGKLRALSEEEFSQRLHPSIDSLQKIGQRVLDEFFESERAKRRRDRNDQDPRRKVLLVSEDFYEAARSKTQARRASSGEGDARGVSTCGGKSPQA